MLTSVLVKNKYAIPVKTESYSLEIPIGLGLVLKNNLLLELINHYIETQSAADLAGQL